MAKITMVDQPEFEVIPPETVIKVKVDECNVEDVPDGKFGPWQKLSLKFEILDIPLAGYDDLIGRPIWGSVPFKFTNNVDNQLRQWVEAILGFQLSVGFELDTVDLRGKRCRAIVSNYTKANSQAQRHKIESLLPWITGDTTDSKPGHGDPWATPAPSAGDWGAPAPVTPPPTSTPTGVGAAHSAATLDDPPF